MFSIIKTLDTTIIQEILSIAKQTSMKEDVSSYAKGRNRIWLNAHWDLKNKKFDTEDCLKNERLWEILKSIWPEAEIGLLTYSGKENPKGINLHRDDSYADYESWGIQLSGTCQFDYAGGYKNFKWEQDRDEEYIKSYILNPGDVYRFNCKNRHSAIPSEDRYAINLWKISSKFKTEYNNAINPIKGIF